MKKTLPLIISLIVVSLGGILFMEVNWFYSIRMVKEEQYHHKIEDAVRRAGNYFVDQKSTMIPGTSMIGFEFLKPTIVKKFTRVQVQEKIQQSFRESGIDKIRFEFAITNFATPGHDEFEMYSPGFFNYFLDTAANYHVFYHLSVASGSMAESLVPDEEMVVVIPGYMKYVWNDLRWILAGMILFTIFIITAFLLTVSNMLRQRKLSAIKSDFINNMTHEFKTPIATISLAVDAIRNEKVKSDAARMDYFTSIIRDENKRMNQHVETILQAAVMDKQEFKLSLTKESVNVLIQQVLEGFRLQLSDKGAEVHLQLNAKPDIIEADVVHFKNLINNLIDNAIKYSKEKLVLNISSMTTRSKVRFVIEDNGIGMNKETVKRIFEKFYRAHTGNLHNVKGFGLGLNYVKTIVDAHKGSIKAESSPGKGSTFTLEFPLAK